MAQKRELEACLKQCEELKAKIIQVRQTAGLQILAKLSQDIQNNIEPCNPELRRQGVGHFGKIYALHWGSDSKNIVTASQDGKLIIWNAQTINKQLAITLNSAWVMTCGFSPSYNLVASGGLDNTVTVYNTGSQETENNIRQFKSKTVKCELEKHDGYLSCARFLNDNEILSSSGDGTCILWDIENKTPKSSYTDHTGDVMFLATNKTSPNLFVSGSVDATAKVWDMRLSNKHVANFIGHTSDINTVQWYPDGKAILTGSDDGSTRLFDTRSYRQLNQYIDSDNKSSHSDTLSGVTSVDISLSGKYIFAAYDNGNVYVWNTFSNTNKAIADINHQSRVSSLAVSYDGYGVATGCWDFNLRIFA